MKRRPPLRLKGTKCLQLFYKVYKNEKITRHLQGTTCWRALPERIVIHF